MTDRQNKWYGDLRGKPDGRVQIEDRVRLAASGIEPLRLPEHVLRLAQTEYVHQQGSGQDYERMQERAGLGILEVIGLLADLAERYGAKPYPPRQSS